MTEVSNGPQFHTFELTANKYRITFMQPPGGPQKSANLQYSEAPTLRSIESDIKRETEEQNPIIETCHQAFHHELPSRSLSDRSLAGPTSMDPVYESSRHFEASKALLPPCPFDPAQNEDEDKEDSEIQVMNSTVGDEGDFAHMTSDSGDDETVVAESPAHYQDDPSPSPSPNSPLIGSPTGVASPEPIKYTWEDSENEVEPRSVDEDKHIKKRRRFHHGSKPDVQKGRNCMSDSNCKEPKTPNSKRIKTVSPTSDRVLSGRPVPRHWDMYEREAVFLMRTFTQNSWEEIVEILNFCFPPPSFRNQIVRAQWAEWSFAFSEESQYDARKRWQELQTRFKEAAEQREFELKPRNRRRKPTTKKEHKHVGYMRDIRNWLLGDKHQMLLAPNPDDMSLISSSPLQGKSTYTGNNMLSNFIPNGECVHEPRHARNIFPARNNLTELSWHGQRGTGLEASSPQSDVPLSSPVTERNTVTSPYFFENRAPQPRILFRVYHEGMPGQNSPKGFRSGRRSQIPRDGVMNPPHTNEVLLDAAMMHLMGEDFSCFVATTTSLIWSVYRGLENKKKRERDPSIGQQHIAMFDADKIPKPTMFHAGSLIRAIKTDEGVPSRQSSWGNFKGNHYCGRYEWMIWGEIPTDAILFSVPLEKLTTATSATHGAMAIADFLSLPHLSTCVCRKCSLTNARKSFLLDTNRVGQDLTSNESGIALGQLATLFGFSVYSEPGLLTSFVHHVCQGWAMMTEDCSTLEIVAPGFLDELERMSAGEEVDNEVAESMYRALEEGLSMANDEIGKERKRLKPSPKKWKASPWKRRKT